MNRELQHLYEADLRDRREHPVYGTREYRELRRKDAGRRREGEKILAKVDDPAPEDYYHLAWLLNQGDDAGEAERAHNLARRAADGGCEPARRLAAAALDRSLMYRGLPQKYGTQIVPDGVGHRLWDVDPATTDVERAAWNVPSLAEMVRRAEEVSRTEPLPPMEEAPQWLLEGIARWERTERQG